MSWTIEWFSPLKGKSEKMGLLKLWVVVVEWKAEIAVVMDHLWVDIIQDFDPGKVKLKNNRISG